MRHTTRTLGARVRGKILLGWIVIQIRPKPALDFGQRHAFAQVIINDLIAPNFSDGKIFRLRMGEVESAHAAAGPHCERFGEFDAGLALDVQQLPERLLFRVIGARRITCCRANAAIFFLNQIFYTEIFISAEAPFLARPFVKILGECFGKPVRKRLGHNRVVIVMLGFEFFYQLIEANAARYRKSTEMIRQPAGFRRDQISEAPIGRTIGLLHLLAEEMEFGVYFLSRLIAVEINIIANCVRREEAVNRASLDQFVSDNFSEQFLRVGKKFARLFAVLLVLKNGRIASPQFPRVKERRPIDERSKLRERKIIERASAKKLRLWNVGFVPIKLCCALACLLEADKLRLRSSMSGAKPIVIAAQLLNERRFQF